MTLKENFKDLMAVGWPEVKAGTEHYLAMHNAYFYGAMVTYVRMLESRTEDKLSKLETELRAEGEMIIARSSTLSDILKAGAPKP
jgi:hypothetical protein